MSDIVFFRMEDRVLKETDLPDLPIPVRQEMREEIFGGEKVRMDLLLDELDLFLSRYPDYENRYRKTVERLSYLLSTRLGKEGNHEKALVYLEMGLLLNPESASLRANYAICLHALGRKEDALVQYRHLITSPYAEVNPLIRVPAARIEAEKGNYEDAHRLLEGCSAFVSKEDWSFWNFLTMMREKSREKQSEENSLKAGIDFLNSGNFIEAIRSLHQALERDSENADAWHGLGVGYHNMNLLFDAVRCYKKAAEINPENPKVWYNLGTVHYSMNDHADALECFVKAARINPLDADSSTWAGISYGVLGDFKSAADYLERAVQLKPEEARVWYYLGQAYVKLFDQASSGEHKTKLLEKTLLCLKNAEEKNIRKHLPEEEYAEFKNQIQLLWETYNSTSPNTAYK